MKILLPLNVKNLNNRMYTRDSFTEVKDVYSLYMPNEAMYNGMLRPENCLGTISNVKFEGDYMVGDVTLREDEPVIQMLIDSGDVVIRPNSIAKVGEDGTVTEAEIIDFSIIRTSQDSFNFPLSSGDGPGTKCTLDNDATV